MEDCLEGDATREAEVDWDVGSPRVERHGEREAVVPRLIEHHSQARTDVSAADGAAATNAARETRLLTREGSRAGREGQGQGQGGE